MPGTDEDSLKLEEYPDAYKTAIDVLRSRGFHKPLPHERYYGPAMLKEVWEKVNRSKQALKCWDFADVQSEWLYHLNQTDKLRTRKYKVVIVDEAQDNTKVQLDLAQALLNEEGRLVLVGDLRQSIFTWRGAFPALFKDADTLIGAKTKELRYNYRSVPAIVQAANIYTADKVWKLGSDTNAVIKADNTTKPIMLTMSDDMLQQGLTIADDWQSQHPTDGGPTAAALVRTNGMIALYEAAMIMRHVPYIIQNGKSLFTSPVAQVMLSYMKTVAQNSQEGLAEIGNIPKRYLSFNFLNVVRTTRLMTGERIGQLLIRQARQQKLSKGVMPNVMELADLLDSLQILPWRSQVGKILEILNSSWNDVGEVHETDSAGVFSAMATVAMRYDSAEEFFTFVERAVRLAQGEVEGPHIVLSTIHRAKGLEWDHVYLDVSDGYLPHRNAKTKDQGEEEQRLLYVGMTRPKKRLCLGYVRPEEPVRGRGFKDETSRGGLSSMVKPIIDQIM